MQFLGLANTSLLEILKKPLFPQVKPALPVLENIFQNEIGMEYLYLPENYFKETIKNYVVKVALSIQSVRNKNKKRFDKE